MNLEVMSRDDKVQLLMILEEKSKRKIARRYWGMFPEFYAFQRKFIKATREYHETLLMAANQVGKTYTGTWIDAAHALGDYPEDYDGHMFEDAPVIWCLGVTGEKARDLLQEPLFGNLVDGKFTGGLIPVESIIDHIPSGTSRLANTVFVKHKSGKRSTVKFFSYSQGQHVLMGDVVDWAHIDEEPKDQAIRPQVLTRLTNGDKGRGGRMILTFTPENGRTDLVVKFMDSPSKSQFMVRAGWKDAGHMTPEKIARGIAALPPHQVPMRTEGLPMLGHGRIYDLSEEFITCDPFEIPKHWFVIGGMDFGYDHPQSQVKLAEDRDTGTFYVINGWKESRLSPASAWGAVKQWQQNVPLAWPHDGLQHEKGSGKQQRDYYKEAGFNMLHEHAKWPDGGNGVEAGINEIRDLMANGKLKVFRGCRPIFDEFLMYHRDEKGRIVKSNDDALDALRYAYMMRRHAMPYGDIMKPKILEPVSIPTVNHWG